MKKHGDIIRAINGFCLNIEDFNIELDGSSGTDFNGEDYCSIKYKALKPYRQSLSRTYYGGVIRFFIYGDNPTKCYDLSDKIKDVFDEKYIGENSDIYIESDSFSSSPDRNSAESKYEMVIDFTARSCHES